MGEFIPFERADRRNWARSGGPTERAGTFFDRRELQRILDLYSRQVMAGEWRDYAIGWDEQGAEFAIYGRLAQIPLYRILKRAKPAKRQGCFQVSTPGRLLGTAISLDAALGLIERRRLRAVGEG